VSNRPLPGKGVFNYLTDLAESEKSAADYAFTVRKMFDMLVEDSGDAVTVRSFLLAQVSAQHQRGLISKDHHELVHELLPKLPAKRRGRPKEALGKGAYGRKHKLYLDLRYEKTVDPSLTKEQFAKRRLGITDERHKNNSRAHERVDALLQNLKPARMKYLDEGQRRAVDTLYPFVLTQDRIRLARDWREAKRNHPELTKEEFVRNDLNWAVGEISEDIIRQQLEYLEQGEKLLAGSERR
jgi:hypothetical protein